MLHGDEFGRQEEDEDVQQVDGPGIGDHVEALVGDDAEKEKEGCHAEADPAGSFVRRRSVHISLVDLLSAYVD